MAGIPKGISEYFRKLGEKGGKKGGLARANSMTPEQRQESARKAAKARWSNSKSRSMFTEAQKARIRRLATLPLEEGGKTQVALAEEHGCSQALISKIVKGER